MNPFSCISRMPSSLVAPQTPACVVTGEPELAGHLERRPLRERRVAGDVEGQLEAEQVAGAGTAALEEVADGRVGGPLPRARPGCCRRRARTGPAPPAARRPRRRRGRRVCSPCDQSTVVVTPASSDSQADEQVAGVDVLGAERLAVLEVVPDEVLGQRPVGAVRRASRSATCAGGCRSCPASRCRRTRRSPAAPSGTSRPAPTAAIRSPTTSTSAPVSTVWLSSMVSTVPPRKTTGRSVALIGRHRLLRVRASPDRRPYAVSDRLASRVVPRHGALSRRRDRAR